MQTKQFIAALTVAFSATAAATAHGDVVSAGGVDYRYRQVARGVFSGVPADEWDSSVHTPSSHPPWWNATHGTRSVGVEPRNLVGSCQVDFNCIHDTDLATLSLGANDWILAADATRGAKELVDYLQSPFTIDAGGIAIAGQTTGSGAGWTAAVKDCSTIGTDVDVVGSIVNQFIAQTPHGSAVNAAINAPAGSWSLAMNTGGAGSDPSPSCF